MIRKSNIKELSLKHVPKDGNIALAAQFNRRIRLHQLKLDIARDGNVQLFHVNDQLIIPIGMGAQTIKIILNNQSLLAVLFAVVVLLLKIQ